MQGEEARTHDVGISEEANGSDHPDQKLVAPFLDGIVGQVTTLEGTLEVWYQHSS